MRNLLGDPNQDIDQHKDQVYSLKDQFNKLKNEKMNQFKDLIDQQNEIENYLEVT